MKVACDFCEKVVSADCSEIKRDWVNMKMGHLEFLLCEKCANKLWDFIDKEVRGESK